LGLIHLIIIIIIIIIAIVAIIAVSAGLHHAIIGIAISVVVIIVAAILFIFTVNISRKFFFSKFLSILLDSHSQFFI